MNTLFASLPYIGRLYYYHTYLFYDEPLVFSCITDTLQYYFLLAIPDDENGNGSWLAAPISSGRLSKLEKNAEEIRAVFTKPESILCRIVFNNSTFSVNQIAPSDLTDDLLPMAGELLDYTDSLELIKPQEEPITQAKKEMRDILEISFERDDTHISEIPCSSLADALNGVQQLVYAIGYTNGGLRGAIPKKVREDCKLCVSGMFAASVGVRLKSDEICDMYFETPLTSALLDFNHLFEVSHDKDLLKEYLSTHNPRVAVKYRTLLKSLLSSNLGLRINNASPNSKFFTRHFSTVELAKNLEIVNSEISEIVETTTLYGQLVGINVERCTFEFIATDGETIKGILANELKSDVFSVPQTVEVRLEISIGSDTMTKEEKLVYKLNEVKPIISENSYARNAVE